MKIQYCSDLHLEFADNKKFLERNPIIPGAGILILSGDIIPFPEIGKHADFFDKLSADFETVYWIPGNHEYYHYDVALREQSFCEAIRENIFLLNNQVVATQNVRLIFSTLWSHISPINHVIVQRSISDFYQIYNNGEPLNVDDFNSLHVQCLNFIKGALQEKENSRTMVITHHVPTFLNYPPAYINSPLNDVFATELHDLIRGAGIAYWLYGHHHRNVATFTIGKTRLITNQLGYVNKREHRNYVNPSIITV